MQTCRDRVRRGRERERVKQHIYIYVYIFIHTHIFLSLRGVEVYTEARTDGQTNAGVQLTKTAGQSAISLFEKPPYKKSPQYLHSTKYSFCSRDFPEP